MLNQKVVQLRKQKGKALPKKQRRRTLYKRMTRTMFTINFSELDSCRRYRTIFKNILIIRRSFKLFEEQTNTMTRDQATIWRLCHSTGSVVVQAVELTK